MHFNERDRFVLLVEDNDQVSGFLATVLKRAGYRVDAVSCGSEAFQRLEDRYYDLLVVDLSVPKRDGLEVVGFASAHSPEAKILAISAFLADEFQSIVMKSGADAALAKPFLPAELLKVVRALVGAGTVCESACSRHHHHHRVMT